MSGSNRLGIKGAMASLIAAGALCTGSFAQNENCPNPKGGDCFTATPGIPGCQDEECCNLVCDLDPICCIIGWDEQCVDLADEFCGVGCPPEDVPTNDDCVNASKLLASDGAAGDFFGYSVAISGDVAIVGAYRDDDGGFNSGSAFVYRFNGMNWVQEQKLLASDGAALDEFGLSVAISGDVAIVGAYHHDDGAPNSGSAYIYRFDGINWAEEQKLLASDGAAQDEFGYSVAISGDAVIVGAPGKNDPGTDFGSAYVYRFDGINWAQEGPKLLASDGAAQDRFGVSVAISGDAAIVGALLHDDNGSNSGSSYVYRFDGTSMWAEEQKLLASDGAFGDVFGLSVAISSDTAIVGALAHDDNGVDSGSAYVYRFDGINWAEEQKLLASDGATEDRFGTSVDISGDVAIVGAWGDDANGCDSGSAYVYLFDGMTWQEQKLLASDGAARDEFGISVAISSDVAIVGARRHGDNGVDSGSAYVFDGIGADCNGNGQADACDIADGTSQDTNGNGIPDECEALVLDLDIKPGSCPNSFNRNSNGVLPVALVGTPDFDVTQVDLSSILLSRADGVGGSVAPNEGPPGPHTTLGDSATPFDGEPCDCHELEGDGITDLNMKFKTVDVVAALELTDLPAGALVSLTLIGTLLDGTPFSADDCVRLVP